MKVSQGSVAVAVIATLVTTIAAAAEPKPANEQQPQSQGNDLPQDNQAAREKQFAEKFSGATLVGSYTIDDRGKKLQSDRYQIATIEKLQKNYWLIVARAQYGDKDVKIPVTVEIHWAGDTPVLSLTDLKIPPLGTFTARVMFYEDRYAGTWQHGEVGGHMWGRIEQKERQGPFDSSADQDDDPQ